MTAPFTTFPIPTSSLLNVAVNRTALAAIPASFGAVYLEEAGRQGTFVWTSGNQSAGVTADSSQGVYVPPNADATGASGAWIRQYGSSALNAAWFGAIADDSTDSLPSILNALAYLKFLAPIPNTDTNVTPRLFIPCGRYFLNGTLNVHQSVFIYGEGGPSALSPGTGLRFPVNTWGVVFHERRTLNNGGGNATTSSGLGDSGGSTLQGILLYGGGAQSFSGPFTNPSSNDTTKHGIWIRTTYITIRDCAVVFFAGNGINNQTTSGSTGANAGNGALFHIENTVCQFNSGDGVQISGSDANAGTGINVSVISNGGAGIRDYSFLGNTWIMAHARDNTIFDPNAGPGNYGNPTGSCLYMGQNYYVVAGQEAAASSTTPGTNAAIWAPYSGQGGLSPTWTSGKTWISGGCYLTNPANVNSRAAFFGCYAELSQPPIQVTYPCIFFGGSIDDGPGLTGSGTWVGGSQFGLASYKGFAVLGRDATNTQTGYNIAFGQAGASGVPIIGSEVWTHQNPGGVDTYRLGYGNTGYVSTSNPIQRMNNNAIIVAQWGQNGDDGPLGPNHNYLYKLHVGPNSSSAWRVDMSSNGPTVDYPGQPARRGDIYFNSNTAAAPGGAQGVVCTLAGIIGSTAVFNPFGLISNDTSGNAFTIKQIRQVALSTISTTVYSVGDTDASLTFNAAGTVTVTLPSASTYSGRQLRLRTIANQAVISAAANVIPLVGGSAATAMLAGTAGKWIWLESDGSSWQVVMGN